MHAFIPCLTVQFCLYCNCNNYTSTFSFTLRSHFITFLPLLTNLLMNVYFVSVHVLAHCMPALHTDTQKGRRKKILLSTYGAQADSSEEMLTSRWVASTVRAVQRKILNVQHECVERKEKKKCLSLHLAPWQTTVAPRAVSRQRDSGGRKRERERGGWQWKRERDGERKKERNGNKNGTERAQKWKLASISISSCMISQCAGG